MGPTLSCNHKEQTIYWNNSLGVSEGNIEEQQAITQCVKNHNLCLQIRHQLKILRILII